MKPFDLKLALEGHEIIGEDGYRGRYVFSNKHAICGDKHFFQFSKNGGNDQSHIFYDEGRSGWFRAFSGQRHLLAIFMAPIKREVWTCVYQAGDYHFVPTVKCFGSEKEAKEGFPEKLGKYIKAIKIHEYEE